MTAPPETLHSLPGETFREAGIKHLNSSAIAIILLFSVISIVSINPYSYGISDTGITIAFVKSVANPSLYPNDLLMTQRQYYYTFLWDALAVVHTMLHIGIPWLYFLGYCVAIVLTFLSVYLIAMALFQRVDVAILALFFLLFSKPALAETATIWNLFITRMAATPVLLLAMYAFLRRRIVLSGILLGVGVLIHPTTVAYAVAMIVGAMMVNVRSIGLKNILLFSGFFLVTASPIIIWKILHSPELLHMIDVQESWLQLLRIRSGHHLFPFSWSPMVHVQALLVVVIFAIAWTRKGSLLTEHRRSVAAFAVTILFLCLIGTICAELVPVASVIVLQPLRSFQFMLYFAMIFVANLCIRTYDGPMRLSDVAILVCLAIGLLFGSARWTYAAVAFAAFTAFVWMYRSRFGKVMSPTNRVRALLVVVTVIGIVYFWRSNLVPGNHLFAIENAQERELLDVEYWSRDHTNLADAFIVPPTLNDEFRVESERTSYCDFEDGGLMNANPSFGEEWFRRMKLLGYQPQDSGRSGFMRLKEADFRTIANEMRWENHRVYLLTFPEVPALSFPVAYRNRKYIVYEVS